MPTIVCNFAALMVAGLFYCWRTYHAGLVCRDRTLRERVAYMLWSLASVEEAGEEGRVETPPEFHLTPAQT